MKTLKIAMAGLAAFTFGKAMADQPEPPTLEALFASPNVTLPLFAAKTGTPGNTDPSRDLIYFHIENLFDKTASDTAPKVVGGDVIVDHFGIAQFATKLEAERRVLRIDRYSVEHTYPPALNFLSNIVQKEPVAVALPAEIDLIVQTVNGKREVKLGDTAKLQSEVGVSLNLAFPDGDFRHFHSSPEFQGVTEKDVQNAYLKIVRPSRLGFMRAAIKEQMTDALLAPWLDQIAKVIPQADGDGAVKWTLKKVTGPNGAFVAWHLAAANARPAVAFEINAVKDRLIKNPPTDPNTVVVLDTASAVENGFRSYVRKIVSGVGEKTTWSLPPGVTRSADGKSLLLPIPANQVAQTAGLFAGKAAFQPATGAQYALAFQLTGEATSPVLREFKLARPDKDCLQLTVFTTVVDVQTQAAAFAPVALVLEFEVGPLAMLRSNGPKPADELTRALNAKLQVFAVQSFTDTAMELVYGGKAPANSAKLVGLQWLGRGERRVENDDFSEWAEIVERDVIFK